MKVYLLNTSLTYLKRALNSRTERRRYATNLITLTAINNGTTLESTDSLFPGEVGNWSRVNISNPCE